MSPVTPTIAAQALAVMAALFILIVVFDRRSRDDDD